MKRFKELLAFALFTIGMIAIAQAVVPTKPYTFVASTPAQSSQVNADFDTLYSVLNANLDSTNISLTNGIGANYIQSDCASCTGAFDAGAYAFGSNATSDIPLTVYGVAGQSNDLFDVLLTSGGTKEFSVSKTGLVNFAQNPTVAGVAMPSAVTAPITNTSGNIGCPGCLTALTAGSNTVVGTGTTPSVAVTAAPSFSGVASDTSTAEGVAGQMVPTYTNSGTTIGQSALRWVGPFTETVSVSSCASGAYCGATSFPFHYNWTSASSYVCSVAGASLALFQATTYNTDSGHVSVMLTNESISTATGSVTVVLACMGY